MSAAKAYGVQSPVAPFAPLTIQRRAPKEKDVGIEILYCGICHSDLHTARDEWHAFMPTAYPCVPGHEIVGRVASVGSGVTLHKVGDIVAVGCQVDTDRVCPNCKAHNEQFCAGQVLTYNSPDKHLGGVTYGGYSESIVVDEHFVMHVPESLHGNLAGVAPLVCAGITTFSPLRYHGVTAGKKVGIVGIGGLGHMGVKFARALGAHVVVFTRSLSKKADALRLGAHEVILSNDPADMAKHAGTFDFILDTVSNEHDVGALINLLAVDGNITLVGASPKPMSLYAFPLIVARRSVSGSAIGSPREIQEMLDFCGKHNIFADVEVISAQNITEAYERLLKSDVKYRFCIDISTLKSQ